MVTGWLKLGNNWYYLNPGNGAAGNRRWFAGWESTWYYMNWKQSHGGRPGSEAAM